MDFSRPIDPGIVFICLIYQTKKDNFCMQSSTQNPLKFIGDIFSWQKAGLLAAVGEFHCLLSFFDAFQFVSFLGSKI
jgi:hypothetical protein